MALTVTAAFNEFQRNIVNLDSSQTDRARASRDWLLGRMNTFPNNDVNRHGFNRHLRVI